MRDDQFAVNDAVGIQLTFYADGVVFEENQVCGELEAVFRDVRDFTERGGVLFCHETTPGHRYTEVLALSRHQAIPHEAVF